MTNFTHFTLAFTFAFSNPQEQKRAIPEREINEIKRQIDELGGRCEFRDGMDTFTLPAGALNRLVPITFRCSVRLVEYADNSEIKSLARHPGIASLILEKTSITDAGLESLPALPHLESVDLSGSKITAAGIRHLAGRKLRTLKIKDEQRNDLGLKHFVQAVESMEQFDSHYGWPGVTDEGMSALVGCESLKMVTWWGDRPIGANFHQAMPTWKGLVQLNILGDGLVDADLAALASLPKFASLATGQSKLSDAGLKHLAKSTSLKELNVHSPGITDEGMKALARVSQLNELSLSGTKITDEGLKHLAESPSLRRLHLERTNITAKGLRFLANRTWNAISIDQSLRTEDVFLILLPTMPLRREFVANEWPLTDTGLSKITEQANLTNLSIRGTFTETSFRKLRNLTALGTLDISGEVSEPGLLELAELKGLRGLSLNVKQLSSKSLAAVARLEKLERLNLDNVTVDEAALAALANSPKLETVNLRYAKLDSRGLQALSKLKSLRWIDLSYTGIPADAVKAFARMRPEVTVYDGD